MRDLMSLVIFFVMMIESAISKPIWPFLPGNPYLINDYTYPLYFGQPSQPPYYLNLPPNHAGIPQNSHAPVDDYYYGRPEYDFRFPLNSIYPLLIPSKPVLLPIFPPASAGEPFDDDSVEKLDSKADPDTGMEKPQNIAQDNDAVIVEAL